MILSKYLGAKVRNVSIFILEKRISHLIFFASHPFRHIFLIYFFKKINNNTHTLTTLILK
jgi:hypothetical protein